VYRLEIEWGAPGGWEEKVAGASDLYL